MGLKEIIFETLVSIIPIGLTVLILWLTHDWLILIVCLSFYYMVMPSIYSNLISIFRFENEWGQHIGQGTLFSCKTLLTFLLSLFLIVLICSMQIYLRFDIPLVLLNEPFTSNSYWGEFLYKTNIYFFWIIAYPIASVYFYTMFLGARGWYTRILSVLCNASIAFLVAWTIMPFNLWLSIAWSGFVLCEGILHLLLANQKSVYNSVCLKIGIHLGLALILILILFNEFKEPKDSWICLKWDAEYQCNPKIVVDHHWQNIFNGKKASSGGHFNH